jgi:hypothetical protein
MVAPPQDALQTLAPTQAADQTLPWSGCAGVASLPCDLARRKELWIAAVLCGLAGLAMVVNSHLLLV